MQTFPPRSEALNLELRQEDSILRLYNPQTGERLPMSDEETPARRAAEAACLTAKRELLAETQARLAAEARAAKLEAEVARLRAALAKRAKSSTSIESQTPEEA